MRRSIGLGMALATMAAAATTYNMSRAIDTPNVDPSTFIVDRVRSHGSDIIHRRGKFKPNQRKQRKGKRV